jgi:hypothetical protein
MQFMDRIQDSYRIAEASPNDARIKLNLKQDEFKDRAMDFARLADVYLSDMEQCPEDKDYVMLEKDAAAKMTAVAKDLEKLKLEWDDLYRKWIGS